jgi:O-antigen ligase
LLRGALYGATAFAGLTIIASVAPVFEGGLKDGTLFYDLGTPRMQFGNSIFLMPAVAYAALRAVKRPSLPALGWVAGLVMSQVLSLTRTSILVTIGVVLLVLAGQFVVRARTRPRLDSFVGVLPTILVVAVGIGAAVGVAEYSTYSAPVPAGVDPAVPRQDPFGRITFTDEQSDVTVIVKSVATGGRFASYLNAARAILRSPVMGGGMGQLVEVAFAYNDVRAYTRGYQPGVDNAYLTVALKAGAIGVASLGAFLLLPALAAIRRRSRGLLAWFLPGWLGLLALTMTQSFAVSSYAPLGVALLASIPFLCVGRPGSLTSGR